jgi:Antibiotic biosynthesis monooxygenase
MMFTTIHSYYIKPGSGSELKQRIQALVEPRISGLPGFVGYYLLEVRTDRMTSISIFESKGHADMAGGPTSFWMRNVLDDSVLGLPEIITGQTDVYKGQACSSQRDRQQVVMDPLMGVF